MVIVQVIRIGVFDEGSSQIKIFTVRFNENGNYAGDHYRFYDEGSYQIMIVSCSIWWKWWNYVL